MQQHICTLLNDCYGSQTSLKFMFHTVSYNSLTVSSFCDHLVAFYQQLSVEDVVTFSLYFRTGISIGFGTF